MSLESARLSAYNACAIVIDSCAVNPTTASSHYLEMSLPSCVLKKNTNNISTAGDELTSFFPLLACARDAQQEEHRQLVSVMALEMVLLLVPAVVLLVAVAARVFVCVDSPEQTKKQCQLIWLKHEKDS